MLFLCREHDIIIENLGETLMNETVLLSLRILFIVSLSIALIPFVIYTYRDAKAYMESGHVPLLPSEKRKRIAIWVSLPLLLLFGGPLLSPNVYSGYFDVLMAVVAVIGIWAIRSLPGVLLLYFYLKNRNKK